MTTDSAPRRGTVYGSLLNHRDALDALGDAVHRPPHHAPPRAPVLYVKPRNCWVAGGDAIVLPDGVEALEIGATFGLVIGRTACRVAEADALAHVAGCVIVDDVTVPHASYYRPSLRYRARDTFCAIGPMVAAMPFAAGPLNVEVEIDGRVVHRASSAGLIRSPARLLAEVSEFMTLTPGDVLCVGVAAHAPLARAGQRVAIEIGGLGRLENPLVAEREHAGAAA